MIGYDSFTSSVKLVTKEIDGCQRGCHYERNYTNTS